MEFIMMSVVSHKQYVPLPLHLCSEPCNFVSNFAYYRLATRFCERESKKSWGVPVDIKNAFVRAVSNSGAGSAFMHGSETEVGHRLDVTGQVVVATLSHQAAISALPAPWNNSTILNSFSKTPFMRGVEQTEYLSNMFRNMLVAEWPKEAKKLPQDVSKPISMIVSSILTLVFPPATVNKFLQLIVDAFKNAPSMDAAKLIKFLQDDYLPTYRNATAHIKLGKFKQFELAKKGSYDEHPVVLSLKLET